MRKPYIRNEELRQAVTSVSKYVRETEWFCILAYYYAEKYHVDGDKVRKYAKMQPTNAKVVGDYKWYMVVAAEHNWHLPKEYYCMFLVPAESKEMAKDIVESYDYFSLRDGYWDESEASSYWVKLIREYKTKKRAEISAAKFTQYRFSNNVVPSTEEIIRVK